MKTRRTVHNVFILSRWTIYERVDHPLPEAPPTLHRIRARIGQSLTLLGPDPRVKGEVEAFYHDRTELGEDCERRYYYPFKTERDEAGP